MLRSLKELQGYKVLVLGGDIIGSVHDFYLDDDGWIIRYLVVDTGTWLPGRKFLISPTALSQPDWELQMFPLKLTKQEVESSPGVDTDRPVSRQQEIDLSKHYGWPVYWGAGGMIHHGIPMRPTMIDQVTINSGPQDQEETEFNPHLRSIKELLGYQIQARDGEIGHVDDFIVDDETWLINYLIVDTGNWLPGRKVLISPHWVDAVSWAETTVQLDLSQETIEHSPEYDPSAPINKEYEGSLFDYYGRSKN